MNSLGDITITLGSALTDNPARVLPVLALAFAVTVIIAIVNDAFLRKRLARTKHKKEHYAPRR